LTVDVTFKRTNSAACFQNHVLCAEYKHFDKEEKIDEDIFEPRHFSREYFWKPVEKNFFFLFLKKLRAHW